MNALDRLKQKQDGLKQIKEDSKKLEGQAPLSLTEEKPVNPFFQKNLKYVPTSVRENHKEIKRINDLLGIRTDDLTAIMVDVAVLKVNDMLKEAQTRLKAQNN